RCSGEPREWSFHRRPNRRLYLMRRWRFDDGWRRLQRLRSRLQHGLWSTERLWWLWLVAEHFGRQLLRRLSWTARPRRFEQQLRQPYGLQRRNAHRGKVWPGRSNWQQCWLVRFPWKPFHWLAHALSKLHHGRVVPA